MAAVPGTSARSSVTVKKNWPLRFFAMNSGILQISNCVCISGLET